MPLWAIFPGMGCHHLNGGRGTPGQVLQGPRGPEGRGHRGLPQAGPDPEQRGLRGEHGQEWGRASGSKAAPVGATLHPCIPQPSPGTWPYPAPAAGAEGETLPMIQLAPAAQPKVPK